MKITEQKNNVEVNQIHLINFTKTMLILAEISVPCFFCQLTKSAIWDRMEPKLRREAAESLWHRFCHVRQVPTDGMSVLFLSCWHIDASVPSFKNFLLPSCWR